MTHKPDLTRVWAVDAPSGNIIDPSATTPDKFSDGWTAEVPPFEHFNFIQKFQTQGLAHINEQGIAVWDSVTTYPIGGLAKGSDGNVYKSLLSQSDNDPVSDGGTNWVDWEVTNRVIIATSVAEVEGLTGVADYQVSLAGSKTGVFLFDSSDLSSEVTADPSQINYIAPSTDATGASGAWVRQEQFYDNTASLLSANNVKQAIDELSQSQSQSAKNILGEGPYMLAATGQSQVVGRCTGGTFKINPNVKIWNIATSQFETADFENVAYEMTMGAGDEAGNGDNNIVLAFAHRLSEETGEEVYIILNGKGSSSVVEWDTGTYTATFKATIAAALADASAPGKTTLDMAFWIQGESDLNPGMTYDTYAGHFGNFIDSMALESYWDKENMPLISVPVSQPYIDGKGTSGENGVQRFLIDLGAPFPFTYGRTLATSPSNLTLCDGVHFDGNSMYELGYNRMFSTLLGAENPLPVGFPVVPPDSSTGGNSIERAGGGVVAGQDVAENYALWGNGNVALGALVARVSENVGAFNTMLGISAGRGYDTIGERNIILGSDAINDMTVPPVGTMGEGNTILGPRCIAEATAGTFDKNVVIGFAACFQVDEIGTSNIVIGELAGGKTNFGDDVIAIGRSSMNSLTNSGDGALAIGTETLGGSNTYAGTLGTASRWHTAVGPYALSHLSTDSGYNGECTALGALAGRKLQNGSDMTSGQNITCLGSRAYVSGNNQVQIGDSATTVYAYGAVQDRSDARDKTEVNRLTDAHIAFFNDIEWVSYRLDYREDYENYTPDGSKARTRHHVGAIAQQVEAAMIEHNVDFAGLQHHSINGGLDVYTMGYQEFIAIQGEIIQRQQKQIKSIEDRLTKAGI